MAEIIKFQYFGDNLKPVWALSDIQFISNARLIFPVTEMSESSLCAQWVAKDTMLLHADSEDSDQTGRIPRLIWVFAARTLILLVLSCRGSEMW